MVRIYWSRLGQDSSFGVRRLAAAFLRDGLPERLSFLPEASFRNESGGKPPHSKAPSAQIPRPSAEEDDFLELLALVPPPVREEVARLGREPDRRARLAGRLLLRRGFIDLGLADPLGRLERDRHGRPRVAGGPDFNLTHSGDLVACAIADAGRVGIDLEAVRPVALERFERLLGPEAIAEILARPDPVLAFHDYWTRLEAALKAEGWGLSGRARGLRLEADRAMIDGRVWRLYPLELAPGYCGHLATDGDGEKVEMVELNSAPGWKRDRR